MQIGRYERFDVERSNYDNTNVVVCGQLAGPPKDLESRIQSALDAEVLLSACVGDLSTWRLHVPFTPKDFLRPIDADTIEDALASSESFFDLQKGPLWRVSCSKSNIAVVSASHVITDGRGVMNLFAHLFGDEPLPLIKTEQVPPVMEAKKDKPDTLFLLNQIFWRMILPACPHFIQNLFLYPAWPDRKATKSYLLEQPAHKKVLFFNSEMQERLVEVARAHKVSVHTILNIAGSLAIYSVFRDPRDESTIGITTDTPISFRRQEMGHPYCTGNYVSSKPHVNEFRPNTSFWDLATAYSQVMNDKKAKDVALNYLACMSFPDKGASASDPTGYKEWVKEMSTQVVPTALGTSDLTRAPPSLDRVTKLTFSQTPNRFQPVFQSLIVRNAQGFSISLNTLASTMVSDEQCQQVTRRLPLILEHVASGKDDTLIIGELISRIA